MATDAPLPPSLERLTLSLLDGPADDRLASELATWLMTASRFRTFVEVHHDKIRKKLRTAHDPEARLDVRAELRVARLLLADRRIELAFEAYHRGGPDFTVTLRGERPFNLEVTRLRRALSPTTITRALVGKLHQLPPAIPNLLLVATPAGDPPDLAATIKAIRVRADARDEAILRAAGVGSTRAFYERFLRLGGVITLADDADGEARATAWINRSARIPLPGRTVGACLLTLRQG